MNVILFDTPQAREALKPFSYTRALAKMRVGIFTIEEKWSHYLQANCSFSTAPYLQKKFPRIEEKENWCINSIVCPDEALVNAVKNLDINQKLTKDGMLIAAFCDKAVFQSLRDHDFNCQSLKLLKSKEWKGSCTYLKNNWDVFLLNEQELRKDFQWICQKKKSQHVEDLHTVTYNERDIFLEEGAFTKAAILNAELGPIYLGKNVLIQERAVIKGPVAIGEGTQISAGAIISHATTVGPYAKVGGEVSNSVILGYSNKAHYGFMGHSVIGEWCNLGAGTNTSDLRNDYGNIKVWKECQKEFDLPNTQFCGLLMGDHSKCGINSMFNPGTVVGISSNLFGAGYFKGFIPSFAWGMPHDHASTYRLDRAIDAAEKMAQRRRIQLSEEDKKILMHVFMVTTQNQS